MIFPIEDPIAYSDKTQTGCFLTKQQSSELALEIAQIGVVEIDFRRDAAYADANAARLLNLRPSRLHTRDELYEHVHPDDRYRLSRIREQACHGNGPSAFQIELRVLLPSAQIRWLTVRKEIRFDELGPAHGFLLAIDVTASREADLRLRENEQQKQEFLEKSTVAAFIQDGVGRFIYVNRAFAGLLNLPREVILGRTYFDFFKPEDALHFQKHDLEILQNKNPKEFLEQFTTPSSVLHLLTYKFVIQSLLGEYHIASLCFDLTKHILRQQSLEQADARKNQFIATLAHELRNPLAPIRNAIEAISLKGRGDKSLLHAASILDRQTRLMSRLLDDLIDMNRITRNQIELTRSKITLSSVINSAIEMCRPLIDYRRICLSVSTPQEEIILYADQLRLTQVLSNLISNAAKYSEVGMVLKINATQTEREVIIAITDTGFGMAPESLPYVFDAFWQGPCQSRDVQAGLGIGLFLVRTLVEMHGGTVNVHSDGLGCGCTFTVQLPLEDDDSGSGRDTGESHPSFLNPCNLRLLVVDDNSDSADSMALQLTLKGHHVDVAYDAETALPLVQRLRPDVILLDIRLPGITGYEAARVIRENDSQHQILLIAMTGWGQPHDKLRAEESGFDHHMTKPVDLTKLDRLLGEFQHAQAKL